jgi:hypothetical protein
MRWSIVSGLWTAWTRICEVCTVDSGSPFCASHAPESPWIVFFRGCLLHNAMNASYGVTRSNVFLEDCLPNLCFVVTARSNWDEYHTLEGVFPHHFICPLSKSCFWHQFPRSPGVVTRPPPSAYFDTSPTIMVSQRSFAKQWTFWVLITTDPAPRKAKSTYPHLVSSIGSRIAPLSSNGLWKQEFLFHFWCHLVFHGRAWIVPKILHHLPRNRRNQDSIATSPVSTTISVFSQ